MRRYRPWIVAKGGRALCSNANRERHSKYAHVFEPLILASGLELRNRIVMGSEFREWLGSF